VGYPNKAKDTNNEKAKEQKQRYNVAPFSPPFSSYIGLI